ncbi:hypothetical protein [Komagataeibacter sucrofermentans]|uniref:hypothetical protein n=1 Tax=Komagataeibacter sucrofermentans TaxID=1053551 RepID=UPI00142DDB55
MRKQAQHHDRHAGGIDIQDRDGAPVGAGNSLPSLRHLIGDAGHAGEKPRTVPA